MVVRDLLRLDFPLSTVLGLFAIMIAIVGFHFAPELAVSPLYAFLGVMGGYFSWRGYLIAMQGR